MTGLLLWLVAHRIRRRQGGEDQLVALDELVVGGRPVTVSTVNVVINLGCGSSGVTGAEGGMIG